MPPQFERKQIYGLEYLEVPGDENAITIIFFHGYGADAFDLLPLSQVYKANPSPRWIFPFGPVEIPLAPGYFGKAWFPIDMEVLQGALKSQRPQDIINAFPPQIDDARHKGEMLIEHLKTPPSKLYVGGFSQGAILATDIALHAKETFAGLVILSGMCIDENQWKNLTPLHSNLSFFQSHGLHDPIIPYECGAHLFKLLKQAGLQGTLRTFQGGHEIPAPVILELRNYFNSQNS